MKHKTGYIVRGVENVDAIYVYGVYRVNMLGHGRLVNRYRERKAAEDVASFLNTYSDLEER